MSRVFRSALACLACLVATVRPMGATVVLPGDLAELSHQAVVIVHGRVIDVRSRRISGSRIDSLVTFEALAYMKGDYGGTVTFQVPGGREGRYRSVVVGAPVLRAGDELVIFLGGHTPALPHLLGMSQGMFRVVHDAATGRSLVSPPPLRRAESGARRAPRGDPSRRLVTVAEFSSQVAAALAARRPASLEVAR